MTTPRIPKFRIALSKLRVSAHILEIEAGRWKKPTQTSRENRKCKICDVLEDEYHFLFECSLYDALRQTLFKKYFTVRPSMFKTVQLLKSANQKQLRNLAQFIFKAFDVRKDVMQNK